MDLTVIQTDALTELINIGVGKAAGVLNAMLNHHVALRVPAVRVMSLVQASQELATLSKKYVSSVRLGFSGRLNGLAALYFPPESAAKLVSVLVGEKPEDLDLDSVKIATLTEVGNILLNGVVGSISNIVGQHLEFSVPVYEEETLQGLVSSSGSGSEDVVIMAETEFSAEDLQINGTIMLLLEVSSFAGLMNFLDGQESQEVGVVP